MKLARLGERANEIPVAYVGESAYDLRSITHDIDGQFFESGGVDKVRAALHEHSIPKLACPQDLRRGAPIARPQAVICIGLNYAKHAAESGVEPPREPVIFFKHPNTVIGPDDFVVKPAESDRLDWEVELAIVIGRRARYLSSTDDGLQHIAGFTISNDVSERTFQIDRSGGQWSKGKSFETFNPLGPWLVTPDELPSTGLRLRSFVNGAARQDSISTDMIFSPGEIVRSLSQFLTLEPGDLINTGTPEGVALSGRFPYLETGDVVRMEIDGLGFQEHRVVDAIEEGL